MSVVIINTTNNEKGFEDRFVDDLANLLRIPCTKNSATSFELLDLPPLDGDVKVLVIVSHADSDDNETFMDLGFRVENCNTNLVNNPDVIGQVIDQSASDRYVIVYCACSALSPATLASNSDNDKVAGVIATAKPVNSTWVDSIAKIIAYVHDVDLRVENNQLITEIVGKIRQVEADFNYSMGFNFYPNIIVSEED